EAQVPLSQSIAAMTGGRLVVLLQEVCEGEGEAGLATEIDANVGFDKTPLLTGDDSKARAALPNCYAGYEGQAARDGAARGRAAVADCIEKDIKTLAAKVAKVIVENGDDPNAMMADVEAKVAAQIDAVLVARHDVCATLAAQSDPMAAGLTSVDEVE